MKNLDHRRTIAIRSGGAVSAVAAGLLLLAACGGGGSSSASSSAPSPSSTTTVTVSHSGGMNVLATSSGRTLYSSAQEKGMALCTSSACNAVWKPLTVAAGHQPTGPGNISAGLSTMKLANGEQQVTFQGRPLYTFAFDHSAGQDNGNGQQDHFGGTTFSWHAVTTSGSAPTQSSQSGSGSSSGSGYGY